MKQFKHSFVVDSNIDEVWKFYTNINHLKIITPKQMKMEILKVTNEIIGEGEEAWLKAKLITNLQWHSKITHLRPYEYVDEMISGRFKIWKHLHKFNKISEDKTEVVDQIDFQLHYGMVGGLFENYALHQLSKIFSYRKQATISALQKES